MKISKFGEKIIKPTKRYNLHFLNGLIFTVLVLQNIISFIAYGEFYSLVATIGLAFGVCYSLLRGINIALYENGIIFDQAIISWNEVEHYEWIHTNNDRDSRLLLFANYKILFRKFSNKEIRFQIKKTEIDEIQAILDNKSIKDRTKI